MYCIDPWVSSVSYAVRGVQRRLDRMNATVQYKSQRYDEPQRHREPGVAAPLWDTAAADELLCRRFRGLRFRQQRDDGVTVRREVLADRRMDILLRQRFGTLDALRNPPRVAPEEVRRHQRRLPVAVLLQ